jgi:6-pyruvoyltetrahydropterin/6-carboxytetrahydropterin synthase
MSKLTCTKRYDDFPFAHRQPSHDGHCALIHGHNWSFEFEFAADTLDRCGFVIDFGKLKWLKDWLNEKFDHTLVLNQSDPWLPYLTVKLTGIEPGGLHPATDLAKIIAIPDCSCEGLAVYLMEKVNRLIAEQTAGRVRVCRVRVVEDSKNHCNLYQPQPI